jgi:hypothetical protein
LIRHRAALSRAQYDEVSPRLVELVKKQPGFIVPIAFEDAQGFCVAELWKTQEQHDRFFDENIAPNVPAEISQEVIEIHNLVARSSTERGRPARGRQAPLTTRRTSRTGLPAAASAQRRERASSASA